ncbi:MAG: hypothetical protein HN337_04135 [Deltaproteobacteria bacterium]|jgi:hypothetical protein|nr:hypothetical protein [Deltaproteobacteria bacterium]
MPVNELTPGTKPTDTTGHDWCESIDERCDQIATLILSHTGLAPDGGTCYQHGTKEMDDLCTAHLSCDATSYMCRAEKPFLTPNTEIDEWKLGESGQYHDVPAFMEVADTVIHSFMPNATPESGPVEIMYFASGNHIAPLELGAKILNSTEHKQVNFTYTEIDQEYYKEIYTELSMLEQQGKILDLKQRKGFSTPTHSESIVEFKIRTDSGEIKTMQITFVLGKVIDGEYPPYFRPSDYDKADIVIGFDAESVDATVGHLNEARAYSKGDDQGKIFIMENRDDYVEWAKGNSEYVVDNFSQHFGCETIKKDEGLNLRPIVFKLK